MDISELIGQVCNQQGFSEIVAKIETGDKVINLKNLAGSSCAVIAAGAFLRSQGVHLFILDDSEEAAYFYTDLYRFLHPTASGDDNNTRNDKVLFFPASYKRNSRYGNEDFSNIVQRTQVIGRVKSGEPLAIVSYPEAVAEMVPSGDEFNKNRFQINVGDKPGIDFLKQLFDEYNFVRTDFVYEPGQYAVRGGIVDVFSFASNKPCRIEFFGDEIESIRNFDLNTQLSYEKLDSMSVISNLHNTAERKTPNIPFTEFIPDSAVVWLKNRNSVTTLIENLTPDERIISGKTFSDSLKKLISIQFNSSSTRSSISFNTLPQPVFSKKFEMLATDITGKINDGYKVCILAENQNQTERLKSIFDSVSKSPVRFIPVRASVHEGFVDNISKICCYTDHQIFQRYHRYRIRGEVDKSNAITVKELTSLNVGDYVVHIDHGIGIFGGLVKTDINGKMQEAVRIRYQDDDTILVNLQGLHRISKYRDVDGLPPKLHKPGSGSWNKLKQSAKKKIKDVASDLIALYAKRTATPGFAFSPDSYMQHELEASFIYEDTPDQITTTEAVKQDMEKACPMDRLVCGDVGFGKTEIAVRAAFKAATDGKQVAVLVPTTILALQHYKSFKERLAEFPVSISYISRMKSAAANRQALADLKCGSTDIIIGTHRLLGKDVEFKDLGLLIIDEEQHFGVASKERLRQKRVEVDTLTLTATPIPRTLQFSLLGARDLSVINTPPPNRIPITTEIHPYSELVIRDAIDFEIQRGGQVFIVHNRIKDIEQIEQTVNLVSPKARTVIAHGQMAGQQIEEIMTDFIDGQYDVLISTTIVESGLDIPNANTIIINQAQNFGLSDLHQLRGRVGRSNRKAYCYLLVPQDTILTSSAKRRLKAIEEFSELGSGFSIAMQDLDIRGAGNLLGGEQSGFIEEIGFETYQKILEEAIAELREEYGAAKTDAPQVYVADTQIDSDIEANFPDEYVSNKTEKLRLYRELDNIDNEEQLSAFRRELIDRFGALPQTAEELLQAVNLRKLAMKFGFERVMIKNKLMFLYFPANQQSKYYSTDVFRNILKNISDGTEKFKLREKNGKLWLLVRDVNSHHEAVETLKKLGDNIIST